ncbi:lipase [Pochonia chlamydosporia 170]|uniref:Lipase n=1 Tax=Pochonia chlamydosporia 170 TaxID=1380566 RepID=A0A179FCX5_METCM|nr:lipase [Pochonia chlamydosporia 170]OAQ63342.1 lipase [Pochonia chlamydosporia 170]
MRFSLPSLALVAAATAIPTSSPPSTRDLSHNDFSCKSSRNPVVLLHGLGATYYEDLNFLETWLKTKGFCTFSLTYGDYPNFPLVGGLQPIAQSSQEIAAFVKDVQQKTGSPKVDLVGHSEGAFQSLYTTKFGGISSIIDTIVAIAPPTHGTSFGGLYKLAQLLGIDNGVNDILKTFGCKACADLVTGGAAIQKLNDGQPIVQQGTTVTVIASKYDELVTPTKTSFIDEEGVNNIYVQDYCPLDPVGHIGEAYDLNVWNLVLNSLEKKVGRKFFCLLGSPGK